MQPRFAGASALCFLLQAALTSLTGTAAPDTPPLATQGSSVGIDRGALHCTRHGALLHGNKEKTRQKQEGNQGLKRWG